VGYNSFERDATQFLSAVMRPWANPGDREATHGPIEFVKNMGARVVAAPRPVPKQDFDYDQDESSPAEAPVATTAAPLTDTPFPVTFVRQTRCVWIKRPSLAHWRPAPFPEVPDLWPPSCLQYSLSPPLRLARVYHLHLALRGPLRIPPACSSCLVTRLPACSPCPLFIHRLPSTIAYPLLCPMSQTC